MPLCNAWLNSVVFGERLAVGGEMVVSGVWEQSIYLGADEFIYEIEAKREGDDVIFTIISKVTILDYFRFVVKRIEAKGGSLDLCDRHHCATLRLVELSWGKETVGKVRSS